jgi:membrane protein
MKKKILYVWKLIKQTFKAYSNDDTWTLGAALSYYTVFSLAPILVIVIACAGFLFGREAVRGEVFGQLAQFLGADGAKNVQDMLKAAYKPGAGTLATIIAVIVLIYGSTSVFYQLQTSLDRIWHVRPKPSGGIKKYIRDHILSFALILGVGFLLLVSLVVSAGLQGFSDYINHHLLKVPAAVLDVAEVIISVGVFTLLFAMIYRFLPDAEVKWKYVWAGSIATAALFELGKFLIGLYIGKAGVANAYGAAGSIALVLVWVNYSSQLVFLGACFTWIYACDTGYKITPSPEAEKIPDDVYNAANAKPSSKSAKADGKSNGKTDHNGMPTYKSDGKSNSIPSRENITES